MSQDESSPDFQAAEQAAIRLAAQNRASAPQTLTERPEVNPDRERDLDAAFAELNADPANADKVITGQENNGVQTELEGTPKTAAVTEEPPAKTEETPPAAPAPAAAPEKKGLLDELINPAKTETAAAPADPYAEVKLRSDASPKTRETFEQLKAVAKQREEAALAAKKELEARLAEAETKAKELASKVVPDDAKTELDELRKFRAQFDTANDPEFRQKFDTRITGNYETVYSQLAKNGLPETELAKLKAMPVSQRDTVIEGFLDKLPVGDRRLIEAKLLDNVNVDDERNRALQEARAKADELLKQRREAPVQQIQRRDQEVAQHLKPIVDQLDWLKVQEAAPTATADEKKRIETANARAQHLQGLLLTAVREDTPEVRAQAALAVPLAHYLKGQLTDVTAERDALKKQLEQIKNASRTSRIASSPTSAPSAATAAPKVKPPENSSDAVDAIFAQLTGQKV